MSEYTNKDEYEMRFWTGERGKEGEYRNLYRKLMDIWGIESIDGLGKNLMEIGTGAFGGFLTIMKGNLKTSVDPLHDRYRAEGILDERPDIDYMTGYFEELDFGKKRYDMVFTKNALDHGDMGFHTLPAIAKLMNKGGRFYVHVNMRYPGELNEGHDHCLTPEDFEKYTAEAGLKVVQQEIFDVDPIHGCYRTLIAVVEK